MTLRAALAALQRNKMRSVLTMLGVIIGVAAVIAMVSVGQGASATVQAQIRSLGTNLLMIIPGATTAAGVRSGWGGVSTLTVADAKAIERECSAVAAVTYLRRQVVQVVHADQNWSTVAQGTTVTFPIVREWGVARGRFFTAAEEEGAARVAVLGQTVASQLFGLGQDPIGAIVRIRNVPFEVIGVLEAKGQTTWGQDQDDVIVLPFTTAERRVFGTQLFNLVDMIFVSARSLAELQEAATQIRTLLRERHRIPANEEDDFTVRSLEDMARATESASRVMTNLLFAVASISLIVGGIGIMNILLVSVTERTREIGLRMAVGAKARHILLQFLMEAVVLSVIGGALGAVLGCASSFFISALGGWPTLLSPLAVFGSLIFSGAVGIFFGYYPAWKASRLEPIAALRYE
ncbi:MAG: ABC transporter permease [Candidatus Binatia bacterium]|nr:ABC transporter permease [Candidatus Binatia bacterium]